MTDWSHYSTPDPEFVEASANTPPQPVPEVKNALEVDEEVIRRQKIVVEMMSKPVEAAGPPVGAIVEEKRIPVTTPPGDIAIRIYTPQSQDASETFPVYVHFHGGGYCVGNLDMDELTCRAKSSKHRIVVVNVDYRLAPQFRWPTGPNDAYDAVKWILVLFQVALNAPGLRVDLKKGFIVGGISAGGNFTCIITQRAREDPELQGKITGQVMQIPETISHTKEFPENLKEKLKSYEEFRHDPLFPIANLELYFAAYQSGDASDPLVSPLLAKSFSGLPPAYVQIAGADALRDEGLLYSQRLEESEVPTKVDVYPGVPHAFTIWYPTIGASVKWRADLDIGIQWLLGFVKQ
ncbi:uncharacterized protein FOMMEDRAFT_151600 [Fomitiporia mediterranea MF3/22]|uniref:uncharacterized protein n=1 Tax=Fomitiporia mediterranea (strain MF3/22) TaxID=694068 RepID=UPI0004408CB3|nr:uncharacterized protein FOMMEDRAFT_151600 [Fomitiporia mediterranea MF3/22]EJD06359.1 hypothetical protein FOMMEDRAFT_151600 [Fomitiporia mediterranea MF3/22]